MQNARLKKYFVGFFNGLLYVSGLCLMAWVAHSEGFHMQWWKWVLIGVSIRLITSLAESYLPPPKHEPVQKAN